MHLQHTCTYALSHVARVINPYQMYVTITVFNSGYHYRLFSRAYTIFMRLSEFAVLRRQMRRIYTVGVRLKQSLLQFENLQSYLERYR